MRRDSIELTLPLTTPPAFAAWLARYRGLLASRLFALPVAPLPPGDRRTLAAAQAALRAVARAEGEDSSAGALMAPEVQSRIHAAHAETRGRRDGAAYARLVRELAGHLAFELFCRARASAGAAGGGGWEVPVPAPARLLSQRRGVGIGVAGDVSDLRIRDGEIVWTAAGRERVLPPAGVGAGDVPAGISPIVAGAPVRESLALALVDENPFRLLEYHPDKQGNALSLGERPVEEWRAALRAALDVIAGALPLLAAEMALTISTVVPVGWFAEKHESASLREVVGLIYLSLHPGVMTMAEALVHEFQHNKINTVFHFDPVIENDPAERYPSPVRPDPRPLAGVLLAAHAFIPVAELYRAMLRASHPLAEAGWFKSRFREIIALNDEGMAVVNAHARPTELGRRVIDEMNAIHHSLLTDPLRG
ncbi:MAG: hypothetical protein HY719_01175 [Planctomycetes bacterium]|nr:hypothetical protein [Planctomycetota bacterium]